MIERITFENFTAFDQLELEFSPGINVFIGKNSTGKTHILKAIYAACDVSKTKVDFAQKLSDVFLPAGEAVVALAKINPRKRSEQELAATLKIRRKSSNSYEKPLNLFFSFPYLEGRIPYPGAPIIKAVSSTTTSLGFDIRPTMQAVYEAEDWTEHPVESVFIPAKDVLANSSGFRALYDRREIPFEQVYPDLISRATLPPLRNVSELFLEYIKKLEKILGGTVVSKTNDEFFLQTENGEIEFILLAEGFRKLGLLTLLLKNGVLAPGTVLCWDEPEANLNPEMLELVAELLLFLQKQGIQIFIATHDYLLARYFDIRSKEDNEIAFFSLYPDNENVIRCEKNREFRFLENNSIIKASDRLLDEVFSVVQGK